MTGPAYLDLKVLVIRKMSLRSLFPSPGKTHNIRYWSNSRRSREHQLCIQESHPPLIHHQCSHQEPRHKKNSRRQCRSQSYNKDHSFNHNDLERSRSPLQERQWTNSNKKGFREIIPRMTDSTGSLHATEQYLSEYKNHMKISDYVKPQIKEAEETKTIKMETTDEVLERIKTTEQVSHDVGWGSDSAQCGGSGWGAPGWNTVVEYKTEYPTDNDNKLLNQMDTTKETDNHFSLLEIVNILNDDAQENPTIKERHEKDEDLPSPVFELFLETPRAFKIRRYKMDPKHADWEQSIRLNEEIQPYACISSKILTRIDRSLALLEDTNKAIQYFYRQQLQAQGEEDVIFYGQGNQKYNLGPTRREEPVWPLKFFILGHPILVDGPDTPPTHVEKELNEKLVWLPEARSDQSSYPQKEAILFGPKGSSQQDDDDVPSDHRKLTKYLKGKSDAIKGSKDALVFEPGLRLEQWSVDVRFKLPLKGTGSDRVLIGPKNTSLGAHIMLKVTPHNEVYVGSCIPVLQEDWDKCSGFHFSKKRPFGIATSTQQATLNKTSQQQLDPNNKWASKCMFSPAHSISEDECYVVRRLDRIFPGWHRLTVTCDGRRQIFYLDGLNIGGTDALLLPPMGNMAGSLTGTPVILNSLVENRIVPMEVLGNRHEETKVLNCGIGPIARLRIWDWKLPESLVERLCGVVQKVRAIQIDPTDPTWEKIGQAPFSSTVVSSSGHVETTG